MDAVVDMYISNPVNDISVHITGIDIDTGYASIFKEREIDWWIILFWWHIDFAMANANFLPYCLILALTSWVNYH